MSDDYYDDEYEEVEGEVVYDESQLSDIDRLIPMGGNVDQPPAPLPETALTIPTLPDLLRQYSALLGWTQAEFAQRTGKDTAVISRIMSGKQRPHDSTLHEFAGVFQQHGLSQVSVDHLLFARDHGGKPDPNPWNLPDHWLRLIRAILARDQAYQDAIYRLLSQIVHETNVLLSGPQEVDD